MTNIDKDEWMDVWNSNVELQAQVKILQSKVSDLESRIASLEEPTIMYGKEIPKRGVIG